MSNRKHKDDPRTFESFPENAECPVCNTNDDGKTVLVEIAGTQEGNLAQAQPFHLACAIVEQWHPKLGIAIKATKFDRDI